MQALILMLLALMTAVTPGTPNPPPAASRAAVAISGGEADDLKRQLSESSLRYFVRFAWPQVDPAKWQGNWHIDAVADHLEAVSEGQIRRLVIMMPPRHMKSINVAVMWPAWHWGPFNEPSMQWMFSSYAERLSIRDSRKTRKLILSSWYQRHWGKRFKILKDQNQKVKFENDQGGYRLATSVGGSNTGEGGKIIAIDDAHNAAEAESDVQRENVTDWFDGVMSTRSNDPKHGAIVINMQRLHECDLVGHQLEKAKRYIAAGLKEMQWEVLCLPARYESSHPTPSRTSLGFIDPRDKSQGGPGDGTPLWPARYGDQELKALELELTPRRAAGQLQQRPAPAGGGIFKREYFRYFKYEPGGKWYTCLETGRKVLKSHCWRFMVADTAMTEKTMADWTVRMVIDVERSITANGMYVAGDMFIVDLWRVQLENPKVEKQFRTDFVVWNPLFLSLEAIGDGGVIFQRFRDENLPVRRMRYGSTSGTGGGTYRIPDKVTKAVAAEVQMSNARIRWEADAPWAEKFERELLLFPNAGNDDQVDGLAQACTIVQGSDFWTEPPPEPDEAGTLGKVADHAEILGPPKREVADPLRRKR